MTEWTSLSYVVVDVEGNGHQPPDLVELAAVSIVAGVVGVPRSWLVKPDQPISQFARRIHGITNEQVADAPVFGDRGDAHPALVCLVVATVVMTSLIATVAVGATFARRSSTRAAAAHTLEALLHLIPWYRRD
ncbi:exonuclease domain-containing protein [Amycolatopsis sp. NPDC101161]|uniref:3'-5' exonuclease n=1 Tax=Amycolatopsis sp. NPDC101161 TaxID=3363940 RepID=UPI00380B3AE2